jgi:hypothetical protein
MIQSILLGVALRQSYDASKFHCPSSFAAFSSLLKIFLCTLLRVSFGAPRIFIPFHNLRALLTYLFVTSFRN